MSVEYALTMCVGLTAAMAMSTMTAKLIGLVVAMGLATQGLAFH